MSWDTSTIAIVIGAVGALTGITSLAWQVFTHFIDKGKLRVEAIRGLHHGTDGQITKREIRCVVTNVGRRSMVLSQVEILYPKGFGYSAGLTPKKQLPVRLDPGDYILLTPDDFSEQYGLVVDVVAFDSLRNKYRLSRKSRDHLG